MCKRVATIVYHTNLRTVECVGIVVKTRLHTTHIRRTDVCTTYLHATLHAQRDIRQGTQLNATVVLASHIIK